ncbi:acyl-ACP desaturase [Hydrocarboniphaga effusa]|uniref:acyl-ACP desaturase n=1 Tax=Hydrocarboniphaga effusa TaxID=243629 RepID=UPI00398BFC5D
MSVITLQGASPSRRRREQMYRDYMEFFEHSDRHRRWSPMSDIPWDLLERSGDLDRIAERRDQADEDLAVCLETFCGVELFIPDYTKNGLNISREIFGQAWFHLSWGYEEAKHALSFREYLLRSGLRTLDQYLDYEEKVLETEWKMPFSTNREMACYGALQEIATYLIYAGQRDHYRRKGNETLARLFELVGRDEAAHASFYRKFMRFEFQEDPEGTAEDLSHVISHFEMPGASLVPEFEQRLNVDGVAISKRLFMERGIMPTLKFIGMTRRDMLNAKRRRDARLLAEVA